MDSLFKVGDVVMHREGSVRMKVSKVEKDDGRIRCTWTRGPVKRSQLFDAAELTTTIKPRVA